MFDVLVASDTHLELKPRWVTTSVAMHLLVVALAVVATQAAFDAPKLAAPDPAMLVFVPKPAPAPPALKRVAPAPTVTTAEPPPKGFQTLEALADIPNVIPPVDLTQRPLDPRDFTGRGVEGGVAEGVVGGTGKVEGWSETRALDAIYEATTDDDRFQPAIMVSQPPPVYPKALEALNIEGRVGVEFVIDTSGKVQRASIRILETSHGAFEEAARAAVAEALFRPARLSGHPVRQLTRQSVRFMVTR